MHSHQARAAGLRYARVGWNTAMQTFEIKVDFNAFDGTDFHRAQKIDANLQENLLLPGILKQKLYATILAQFQPHTDEKKSAWDKNSQEVSLLP
jgi:hypothetical protein